jgi:hypothetical protein
MPRKKMDPRETFRADRVRARGGKVVYDGDRFPIAFTRPVQDRIDQMAEEHNIPRSVMIRWLVDLGFETLDRRARRTRYSAAHAARGDIAATG